MTPKELNKLKQAKAKTDQSKQKKADLEEIEYKTALVEERKRDFERKANIAERKLYELKTELSTYAQLNDWLMRYLNKGDDLLDRLEEMALNANEAEFQYTMVVHKQLNETIGKITQLAKSGFFSPTAETVDGIDFVIRLQQGDE